MTAIVQAYHNLKGDKLIWLIVALLSIVSILAVYSSVGSMAYQSRGGNTEYFLFRHAVFIAIGVGMAYISYQLHYMQYSKLGMARMILNK